MIKRSRTFVFTRAKLIALFIVLWAHITLLDLFIVVQSGPRFFWQQSLTVHTVSLHFSLALLSTFIFYLFSLFFQKKQPNLFTKNPLKSEITNEL